MEDFISQDEFNLELSAFDEALINIECDEILVLADKFLYLYGHYVYG